MAYTDLTALSNVLRVQHQDRIAESIWAGQKALGFFAKETVDGGSQFEKTVRTVFGSSVMGQGEHAYLPKPSTRDWVKFVVTPIQFSARGQITKHAIAQGRGWGAVATAMKEMTDGVIEDFKKGLAHSWYGNADGLSGVLAIVGETATSATQNVRYHDTAGTREAADSMQPGNAYLIDGKNIYFNSAANLLAGGLAYDANQVATVLNRGTTAESLVLSASKTMTADDLIVPWNGHTDSAKFGHGYGVGLTSIFAHINNDTGTYQGESRSTHPQIRANVSPNSAGYVAGTSNLTEEDMITMVDECDRRTNKTPDTLLTSYGVRRAYWSGLENLRRFPSINLEGGMGKLGFANIGGPITVDSDCPPGVIFMYPKKVFKRLVWDDFGWLDEDGNILSRITDQAEFECTYMAYFNTYCEVPSACAIIKDIQTTEINAAY